MKTFYQFYEKMLRELAQPQAAAPQAQAPQPAQPVPGGAGQVSPPVPPPDANLLNGVKALAQVQDPKVKAAFMQFQKQLQGAGVQVPGMSAPNQPQPTQAKPNQAPMQPQQPPAAQAPQQ